MADGIKRRGEDDTPSGLDPLEGVDLASATSDSDPGLLTPGELKVSAARTLYEAERSMIALGVAIETQASNAGLDDNEIRHVQLRAERDEYHALGFEGDADAKAAGY